MTASLLQFSLFAVSAPLGAGTINTTVDFSSSITVGSASGLLIGNSPSVPKASVSSLRPALWRFTGTPELYLPYGSSGTALQFVMSDAYCYASSNWCGKTPPYQNWTAYEALVRQQALDMKGKNVMFDVWNEPDYVNSWSGTRDQFFQTYLHAYRVIRQVLGAGVTIGGPSLAGGYDKAYIQAFLDFCLQNGCEVNFLSWHEFLDTDSAVLAISTHIADARASFVNNPRYKSLKMGRIDINEMIGQANAHRPGAILGSFYQIEKGKADGAAKTCWPDSKGQNECFNGTLDGLLTSGTQQPRSAWWVVKSYADGVSTRVSATTTDEHVAVFGSQQSANASTAQVLAGYFNNTAETSGVDAPVTVNVSLRGLQALKFLSGSSRVLVQVDRIPDSGEAPLTQPVFVRTDDLAVASGTAALALTNVTPGQAYRLTLSKPPSPAPISIRRLLNRNSSEDLVAPGSVLAISGATSAAYSAQAESVHLPDSLQGIRVLLNGSPIPLLSASPDRIEAQIPYETQPGSSVLVVQSPTGSSLPVMLDVSIFAPSLRKHGNAAVTLKPDGSERSDTEPVAGGSVVALRLGGLGHISPLRRTGTTVVAAAGEDYKANTSIRIGDTYAEVLSVVPDESSLDGARALFRVPMLTRGSYPVEFTINGFSAPAATIQIE